MLEFGLIKVSSILPQRKETYFTMKKLIIILGFILSATYTFGQSLQKSNLLGFHILKVELKSNITIEQVKAFYTSSLIPEYEKQFSGVKGYLLTGVPGDSKNSFGLLWIFESQTTKDKYYNKDEVPTALGNSAIEKLNPINQERDKFGIFTSKYTNWLVE